MSALQSVFHRISLENYKIKQVDGTRLGYCDQSSHVGLENPRKVD